MSKSKRFISTITVGAFLALLPVSFSQESTIGGLTGNGHRGAQLYRRYCVGCHGEQGNGEGENARFLEPRPRDFTSAVFKCRSTPTGSLPLDSDLYQTLERGVHASAMPSWYALTRQERVDLIAYVKGFSERFKEEKPQPALSVPPEPAASQESINRGKDVFRRMECSKCHGAGGRGDGPSSATLTDSKNHPIVPYDFTAGERFKCGQTNEDLYRIFMTGLDGTPMPSYTDNLKPEEAWDLVHFLRTLQTRSEPKNFTLAGILHGNKKSGKAANTQRPSTQRTSGN